MVSKSNQGTGKFIFNGGDHVMVEIDDLFSFLKSFEKIEEVKGFFKVYYRNGKARFINLSQIKLIEISTGETNE